MPVTKKVAATEIVNLEFKRDLEIDTLDPLNKKGTTNIANIENM
jgi:hypothetical protein